MTSTIGHVENPSARILFTQITQTAPGQCAICGSGQDENGFADTQLDFEFWGRVYFCSKCTAELAAVFGFISPLDYAELEDELNLAKLNHTRHIEKIDNLERIIDGIAGLKSLVSSDPFSSLPSVETPKQEIVSTGTASNIESKSNDTPVKSDKSTTGKSEPSTKSPSKPGLLNL